MGTLSELVSKEPTMPGSGGWYVWRKQENQGPWYASSHTMQSAGA